MRNLLVWFCLLPAAVGAQADDLPARIAGSIMAEDMKSHVYLLASPELEGRETGTEGNLKAAVYIAEQLSKYGISPSPGDNDHFQEVAFTSVRWSSVDVTVNGAAEEHLKGFLCLPQDFPAREGPIAIDEMLFLGYGLDDPRWSDYEGVDVKGKHLIVYGTEPLDKDGNYVLTGTSKPSEWSMDPTMRLNAAAEAGAASIWIIDDKLREKIMYARRFLLNGSMQMGMPEEVTRSGIPHALITPELAQRILGASTDKVIGVRKKMNKKGTPQRIKCAVNVQLNAVHDAQFTMGLNVLGYIEGTDPALRQEVVVVSAHYDHLGMRGSDIFFGADDNASGSSAVLEIAQAMAMARASGEGPRRSVLCLWVTGEEKGLLGSEYYSEHPVFPLENTVADVNIDMIGRVDKKHDDPRYTYVIGSDRLSTELHAINEEVNRKYTNLALDYTYNADDDPNRFYYRSDHYNFARNGIPSIFYFSGVHDDYHRPTDTPDKIMYDKAETIARLAFHTAWELANRDERIRVDVTGRN